MPTVPTLSSIDQVISAICYGEKVVAKYASDSVRKDALAEFTKHLSTGLRANAPPDDSNMLECISGGSIHCIIDEHESRMYKYDYAYGNLPEAVKVCCFEKVKSC